MRKSRGSKYVDAMEIAASSLIRSSDLFVSFPVDICLKSAGRGRRRRSTKVFRKERKLRRRRKTEAAAAISAAGGRSEDGEALTRLKGARQAAAAASKSD